MPPENLATTILRRVATDLEAAMVVGLLEANGIEATLEGEYSASFRAEAPQEVAVRVRTADLKAAQELLATTARNARNSPA